MIESLIEYDSQVTETVAQPDCKDVASEDQSFETGDEVDGRSCNDDSVITGPGSGLRHREETGITVCTAATFASSSGPGRDTGTGTKMGNRSGTDCDARP